MEVEFRNVTITIGGVKDATDGYNRLCEILSQQDAEYTTDTYVAYDKSSEAEPRDTKELWPQP